MKRCPYCAEEIQDAARVCRFCGRSVAPLRISFGSPRTRWIVGTVSALIIAAMFGRRIYDKAVYRIAAWSYASENPRPLVAREVLTRERYDQLQLGVTVDSAKDVLGSNWTHEDSSRYGDSTTDTYVWRTNDGRGRVVGIFENGRLRAKSQSLGW